MGGERPDAGPQVPPADHELVPETQHVDAGLSVRDVDCDFRLMRRAIFEKIDLEKTSGVICLEMMKKIEDAGFRIVEVPVHHYHRAFGKSQFFNFRRIAKTGVDVLRLWYELVIRRHHLRRGARPLAAPADPRSSPRT